MAEKRTKFDKLQRNVERLAMRDAACRERSDEERPEPLKAESENLGTKTRTAAA